MSDVYDVLQGRQGSEPGLLCYCLLRMPAAAAAAAAAAASAAAAAASEENYSLFSIDA